MSTKKVLMQIAQGIVGARRLWLITLNAIAVVWCVESLGLLVFGSIELASGKFTSYGVLEPIGLFLTALLIGAVGGGILARRQWARTGGFILSGMNAVSAPALVVFAPLMALATFVFHLIAFCSLAVMYDNFERQGVRPTIAASLGMSKRAKDFTSSELDPEEAKRPWRPVLLVAIVLAGLLVLSPLFVLVLGVFDIAVFRFVQSLLE